MSGNTAIDRHIATEQRLFDEILEAFPSQKHWAETVFSRLKRIVALPEQARELDVGAAAGGFLIACSQLEYRCEGMGSGISMTGGTFGEKMRVGNYIS